MGKNRATSFPFLKTVGVVDYAPFIKYLLLSFAKPVSMKLCNLEVFGASLYLVVPCYESKLVDLEFNLQTSTQSLLYWIPTLLVIAKMLKA